MRKKLPIDIEQTNEFNDDFGEIESPQEKCNTKPKVVSPIHENWNIVKAFNAINNAAPKSQLNKNLFIRCAEAFSFLSDKLGLNPIQCIVIAILIEEGSTMSFREMGKILGLTRLSMMTYYNDIEELFKMRWLQHRGDSENDGIFDGYALAKGVISAIRENRPFKPEVLECEDTQEFVDRVAEHIRAGYEDENIIFTDEKYWLQEMVNANAELPICKVGKQFQGHRLSVTSYARRR